MSAPLVAISISDQVEKAGAIAGFAAVLGLAVLALLYFASAREVKRLREWADRAPERVADIEARLAEISRQRAAAPKPIGAPAATGSAPATAAAAAAVTPGAQAEDAKPAVSGEEGAPDLPESGEPATEEGAAPAAEPVANGDAPQPAPAKPGLFDGASVDDLTQIRKPPQMETPAGTKRAGAPDETLVGAELRQNRPSARPRPQAPVRPSTARLMESARISNAQRARTGGGPPVPPPALPPTKRRWQRPLLIGAGVLGAIAAVVIVASLLTGGDKPPAPNKIVAVTTPQDTTSTTSQIDRANTEVVVFNGTTINGLAKTIADKLTDAGFKRGDVTDALDQQRSATIVQYKEGQRAAALEVADLLPGVGADAVSSLASDPGTAARAPNADVVVTVGADQSTGN